MYMYYVHVHAHNACPAMHTHISQHCSVIVMTKFGSVTVAIMAGSVQLGKVQVSVLPE